MADRSTSSGSGGMSAGRPPEGKEPEPSMAEMAGENFGEGVQIEMPMTDQRVREIVAEMLAAQPKAAPAPAPEARSGIVQWKHDADHGETESAVKAQHERDVAAGLAYQPPPPDM